MTHVVVIGAGQAGSSLVAKLRNSGFDGKVTLIGEEPVPPYQRPPLSKKYLLGEMSLDRLLLRPQSFYEENDIDLRLGMGVSKIDPAAKKLTLGQEEISFDELVFTTGSTPRRLPAAIGGDLKSVYVVRSLADVDAMEPEFAQGRNVVIVGGGYIGLEAAAVAAAKGLNVTVVEMADRILQRVACKETSDYFRDLHKSHGVQILEGVGLSKLIGDEKVSQVELTNGEILNVDFVIAGVGITPETQLAEEAGMALSNGIQTDEFGRCSVQGFWAAGDCASFPYRGERIRLESVPNAIDQAEIVAQNLMGAEKPYSAKPWFWSDQYDITLQIAGLNTGFDNVVTRKSEEATSFWYFLGSDLLAVDAMNDPRAYMVGKRLIEAGKSADPIDVENVEVDLKTLLR